MYEKNFFDDEKMEDYYICDMSRYIHIIETYSD